MSARSRLLASTGASEEMLDRWKKRTSLNPELALVLGRCFFFFLLATIASSVFLIGEIRYRQSSSLQIVFLITTTGFFVLVLVSFGMWSYSKFADRKFRADWKELSNLVEGLKLKSVAELREEVCFIIYPEVMKVKIARDRKNDRALALARRHLNARLDHLKRFGLTAFDEEQALRRAYRSWT